MNRHEIIGQGCPCCANVIMFGAAMSPDDYRAALAPTGYELCAHCGDELVPIERTDDPNAAPGAWTIADSSYLVSAVMPGAVWGQS